MRAVLDPNILISALLSPDGAPAELLTCWLRGEFELVISERLLDELERVFAYPKIRHRIAADEAASFLALLRASATCSSDVAAAPRAADPGDDYLLALAEQAHAFLVSGDRHVLALADVLPVETARGFLERMRSQ